MHFDPDKEITVKTDSFDFVTVEVMSQRDSDNQLRSVAYFSSKMLPAECNYEIYDKELLAIIRAFEEWRPELEDTEKPVEVISDHKNLEYFMSTKLLSRRQARWSEFLSRFNFRIVYRSGGLNTRADALTRRSGDLPLKEGDSRTKHQWQTVLKSKNLQIQAMNSSRSTPEVESNANRSRTDLESNSNSEETSEEDPFNDSEPPEDLDEQIAAAYANDEWIQAIVTALTNGSRKLPGIPLAECQLRQGRVYFRDQLVIPDDDALRLRLIQLSHDTPVAGHPGGIKTY